MRKVVVVYHHEEGQWWAESPDPGLEGFAAGGATLDEARRQVQEGLDFYFEQQVKVDERFDSSSIVTLLDVRETSWSVSISAPTERGRRTAAIRPHPAPVPPRMRARPA